MSFPRHKACFQLQLFKIFYHEEISKNATNLVMSSAKLWYDITIFKHFCIRTKFPLSKNKTIAVKHQSVLATKCCQLILDAVLLKDISGDCDLLKDWLEK